MGSGWGGGVGGKEGCGGDVERGVWGSVEERGTRSEVIYDMFTQAVDDAVLSVAAEVDEVEAVEEVLRGTTEEGDL